MGREIAGWSFVGLGVALIAVVLHLALSRAVSEAVAVALPATIVFRAGISLVKLGVAGRIVAGEIGRGKPERQAGTSSPGGQRPPTRGSSRA